MEKKKVYEKPEAKVVKLENVDIITCSGKICDGSCGTTLPEIPFPFSDSLPSF